jgi:hypothetical protein
MGEWQVLRGALLLRIVSLFPFVPLPAHLHMLAWGFFVPSFVHAERAGDEVQPLQLLQDDFKSVDQETRVRAIKRCKLVGDVIGPEQTRSQLIPFLTSIADDDDEVLLALADQLGRFISTVGGPAHAHVLLPW